ncbi:MAG TPA: hypothetical protein VF171_01020 [Trueperaceae bacterium]
MALAFWAGRATGTTGAASAWIPAAAPLASSGRGSAGLLPLRLQPIQGQARQDLGPPADPRELVPLPGPPGQAPGLGAPQAQPQGQCPLYLDQDGKLYQFQRPGPPGGDTPGRSGSPELVPLEPNPGTPAPIPPPRPAPPERTPGRLTVQAGASAERY